MTTPQNKTQLPITTATEICIETLRLRKTILQPINDRYYGPLDKTTVQNTAYPLVLLLGNHSSGKSSFVNWILKRDVQISGVAPTDDCFTILGPAPLDGEDLDRAGPALLGDPDLGFSGLRVFGPMLEHRTQLKLRTDTDVSDFMIVDTPGMIDSPLTMGGKEVMDRGYDFQGVCRWYAERADVILLFFDPDKPGTTGETLTVLTNSLAGLDYKLHIILNKADQFSKMHDFARAYGSLCWNLSKVIPRKDLPQIHTMCLPAKHSYAARTPSTDSGTKDENATFLGMTLKNMGIGFPPVAGLGGTLDGSQSNFHSQGFLDLESARTVVEKEVFNAPKRRVDNEISRLADSVHSLVMHLRVVDDVVEQYQTAVLQQRLQLAGCLLGVGMLAVIAGGVLAPVGSTSTGNSGAGAAVAGSGSGAVVAAAASATTTKGLVSSAVPVLSTGARAALLTSAIGGAVTGVVVAIQSRTLALTRAALCSARGFGETFAKLHARAIAEKDVFTSHLWESVLPAMLLSVTPDTLQRLPRVRASDVQLLERVLSEDVANLRRKAKSASQRSPSPVSLGENTGGDLVDISATPATWSEKNMTPNHAESLSRSPSPVSNFDKPEMREHLTPVLLTPSKLVARGADLTSV